MNYAQSSVKIRANLWLNFLPQKVQNILMLHSKSSMLCVNVSAQKFFKISKRFANSFDNINSNETNQRFLRPVI